MSTAANPATPMIAPTGRRAPAGQGLDHRAGTKAGRGRWLVAAARARTRPSRLRPGVAAL